MDRSYLDRLISERAQVMRMLGNIPIDRVIDRGSLEYRLDELHSSIQEAGDIPAPAKAVITFNGNPIVGGSHGIYFDFATKALSAFANAVALLAVPGEGTMGDRGRIPGKQQNSLVITGTALGSFGFELEEAPTSELPMEEGSATAQALEQITDILASSRSSDDELARSISDAHPRALSSVRSFLEILSQNEAVMALKVKNRSFRFTQVAEVQQSLDRLKVENVHEKDETLRGRFIGLLPHRRTFEFVKDGEETPISGKIKKGLEGLEAILDHRKEIVEAKFRVTSVGSGRASYVLAEVPIW